MDSRPSNTEQWNADFIMLSRSRLKKFHRELLLKRSLFHNLVTEKTKKILEIGCGSGPILEYLALKGFVKNLYGIEPDAELTKHIPSSIAATIKNCGIESIDFGDCTFDAVLVYGVFHHLSGLDAYRAGCDEIHRILKPGGFIFIMEPGRYRVFRGLEAASKFLGMFSATFKAFSRCNEEEKTEQHFFLKNHGAIRDYMTMKNFKVIKDGYFLYSWIFTAQKQADRK